MPALAKDIRALDIQRQHEQKLSKVGGVNDPGAAQAAFRHLFEVTEPTAQVTLREGGRIIAQGMGQAVWCDLIRRWLPPELVTANIIDVVDATGANHDSSRAA